PFPVWRRDGASFFWYTERNGGPEIELRRASGEKLSTWVPPSVNFRQFVGFDEASGWLYFIGQPEQPVHELMRVRDGQKPERVNTGHDRAKVQTAALSRAGGHLVV